MEDSSGLLVAAPVIVAFPRGLRAGENPLRAGCLVALDFEPQPGYWQSADGVALMREMARVRQPGRDQPEHRDGLLRHSSRRAACDHGASAQRARAEARRSDEWRSQGADSLRQRVNRNGDIACDRDRKRRLWTRPSISRCRRDSTKLPPSTAKTATDARFMRTDSWWRSAMRWPRGPVLGVKGDFLSLDGKSHFSRWATNYFTTEENGWDFRGAAECLGMGQGFC